MNDCYLDRDGWTGGRMPSGHEGLDALLFGGYPIGLMTLIEGSASMVSPIVLRTKAKVYQIDSPFSGKEYANLAKADNVALVIQTQGVLSKRAKFHAFVHLQVSDEGILKVLKDHTCPRQGYTIRL